MKKLFVFFIIAVLSSCNNDDASFNDYQVLLPVESAIVPDEFELGQTYEITIVYLRPSTCHAFNDIYYQKHQNERTVAIVSTVFQSNGNCTDLEDTELEASFNFKATQSGSYIFKFWKGKDENGEDTYITMEVPVI